MDISCQTSTNKSKDLSSVESIETFQFIRMFIFTLGFVSN